MATGTVIASLSLDLTVDPGSTNFVRWRLEQSHPLTATTESAVQFQIDPNDALSGDDMEVIFALTNEAESCTADTGTNKITLTAHGFAAGDIVVFGGTAVPSGLTAGTRYFVRDTATNDFKVAATRGGSALALGSTGTAVTVRRLITASTTEPYAPPGVPVLIRQPGGVLDFSLVRALQVTLSAKNTAADALATLRVTAGDPADEFAYANLPLTLDFTASGDEHWPSALLQCPAGLTFDPAYPLRLEVRAGDSNTNARVLIQLLGL